VQRQDGSVANVDEPVAWFDEGPTSSNARLLHDARPHDRALVAAAWIERLAATVPCVVVINEVHRAGSVLARHWGAACLIALGHEAAAAREMRDVVEMRSQTLAADDDRLLASRQVFGSALARSGKLDLAMTEFNSVIRERKQIDVLDAPNLLDARASRAGCLTFLVAPTKPLPNSMT
jgi:hypothetical protein